MPLIILVFFFILMLFEAAGHLIFVFIISTQKYKIVVKMKNTKKQVKQWLNHYQKVGNNILVLYKMKKKLHHRKYNDNTDAH